jgi:hemolysin activation/secretion protein
MHKAAGSFWRLFLFCHYPMKSFFVQVFICAILPISVFGVGAEDASRPVPLTESDSSERPRREEPAEVMAGKDQILVPSLLGLAIGKTSESALGQQQQLKSGVVTEGFSDADAAKITKIAAPTLGQPVTLRSLKRLGTRLEAAFRSSGGPVLKVSFPPQEITSGVIAILVCPARVGSIRVAGKPSFGMKFAANAFRTETGKELSGDVVMEDLDWINLNPLRRATLTYGDGVGPDEIDLKLRLRADKPWRAYTGIDNQLSDHLGNERVFFGFQYGDLFSLDQRVTAQYTSSLDSKSLRGISGIYQVPLPIRHLIDVSLGYTESESDSAGPIDQSGQFSRAAVVYRVPLPRWKSFSQEWRVGMVFRENAYLFTNNTRDTVRFLNLETGWKGRRNDLFGYTLMDVSLLFSPGQGILGSKDADFIALGADGAESLIVKLEMERTLKLSENITLLGRCRSQWADSDLLSSDQISAGGYGLVRGFDETVGYASNGVVATVEFQSGSYRTMKTGDYQAVTFLDAAFLNRDEADDAGQLASIGVGLRWRYAERLSARVDLAVPIDRPELINSNPMLHFSVSTTW